MKHNLRFPARPARPVWRLSALVAALLLAGCASLAPTAEPALPEAPGAFKAGAPGGPAASVPAATAGWWTVFGDPVLDDLVRRADGRNTGLQLAAARLTQARALVRRAAAERRPQVNVSAAATREDTPLTGGRPATSLGIGASVSYEVDLAGRLAGTRDAAALDAREREELLHEARLLVHADVARAYFTLRALDAERALVRGTVASYRDTLSLTERRLAAGDVPELDVARVRSELAANEAEALALDRQRSQVEHALALLVGEPASAFEVAAAGGAKEGTTEGAKEGAAEWRAALPQVPAGVPSATLARRPDIAAARSALLAAQARLGVAQSAWWPALSLTASGGQASPELSDLLRSAARTWGIGALLSLPVFDGGRRGAQVAQSQAEVEAAWARYREQALVAFKEVEDELAALGLLAQQGEAQARAVEAAARVTALSATRYRNGLVSQLDLLDAQRSELRNRRQALQVRAAQVQTTVGLIRALGGGWGPA